MKKIILTVVTISLLSTSAFAFSFFKKDVSAQPETMQLFNSVSTAENKVWAGTFELVWNDLMDNVVKAPVKFTDGDNAFADELNKQNFQKQYLSENSYYTAHGFMTKNLKSAIEKALKEKFDEKSDILESLEWGNKNFLVYAMLKKDFEFIKAFKELKKEKFAGKGKKVKYFGIEKNGDYNLRDSVSVLFYNNKDDFAVKIFTKTDDKVILYRSNENLSFEEMYNNLLAKSSMYNGVKSFTKKDELKVPFIDFKTKHLYEELSGKAIVGTEFTIDQALQTINFKIDNKGVKLKSEAALTMKMSLAPIGKTEPRKFYFNDAFVLYLIEKDKPYFALRVGDIDGLGK